MSSSSSAERKANVEEDFLLPLFLPLVHLDKGLSVTGLVLEGPGASSPLDKIISAAAASSSPETWACAAIWVAVMVFLNCNDKTKQRHKWNSKYYNNWIYTEMKKTIKCKMWYNLITYTDSRPRLDRVYVPLQEMEFLQDPFFPIGVLSLTTPRLLLEFAVSSPQWLVPGVDLSIWKYKGNNHKYLLYAHVTMRTINVKCVQ